MLKLKCRHCKTLLLEAEERWERVAKTGMCPECSWFYDEAKELEAERAAYDPAIISSTRRLRVYEIAFGSLATAGALIGIAFTVLVAQATGSLHVFLGLGFLLLCGLRTVLHGLVYDPRREARPSLSCPTDLRALAKRQEAEGVFFE